MPASHQPFILPTLVTPRLMLRAFTSGDAANVQRIANDYDVAYNLAALPHPYLLPMANDWIAAHNELHSEGTHRMWAITPNILLPTTTTTASSILGAISLVDVNTDHRLAELGYWLGKEFWGQGIASEAATAVLGYAFEEMQLERVFAKHFERNAASGKVLQKVGMRQEGVLRNHYCKWGEFQNLVVYGILHNEWFLKQSS
jgi:[ribosomal protein S5]-alanine N-acetyltransferase